ncbi:MAG: hypothetical protein EBS05_27340 [Proteobacteria bacterium]|nr:hypothetical protein [Pseudomonadota bacterium]
MVGSEPRTRPDESPALSLPSASARSTNGASRTVTPPFSLPLSSKNQATPADLQPAITVPPLLNGKAGATWREQQLARQAAEQKAREEEQHKLKDALYRFLLKDGTNR